MSICTGFGTAVYPTGTPAFANATEPGYRVLAEYGDGDCKFRTRNGHDATRWFPEVAQALAKATHGRAVVDGEMCTSDGEGRSDFDSLHARARRRRWSAGDAPVTFCAFDLLVASGRSVMELGLIRRKALMAGLLAEGIDHVLFARHVGADDVDNPVSWLYARALESRLEGVVGKLADSIYRPGQRTPDWFKLKRPGAVPAQRFRRRAEVG